MQQDVIDNPYLRPGKMPKVKVPVQSPGGGTPTMKKELMDQQ